MSSAYSAVRAAEDFVLSLDDDQNMVQATRNRALELRAMAGEASLKLSERASDSADSVLAAAMLLRDLNGCLHQVRSDIRDSKQHLKQLEEDIQAGNIEVKRLHSKLKQGNAFNGTSSSTVSVVDSADSEMNESSPQESALTKKSREGSLGYFSEKTVECERCLAFAATSSSEWLVCLTRVSEEFFEYLDATAKESIELGWIGRFPEWSSKRARSFFLRHFLSLTLSGTWMILETAKGEELTEEQWHRLAEGSRVTLDSLRRFNYLFVQEAESPLLKLVATLLNRAKEELTGFPESNKLTNLGHPLTRALRLLRPLLSCHRLMTEMVAPIVLVRCSMFIQTMDENSRNDVRMALNNILMSANICLID